MARSRKVLFLVFLLILSAFLSGCQNQTGSAILVPSSSSYSNSSDSAGSPKTKFSLPYGLQFNMDVDDVIKVMEMAGFKYDADKTVIHADTDYTDYKKRDYSFDLYFSDGSLFDVSLTETLVSYIHSGFKKSYSWFVSSSFSEKDADVVVNVFKNEFKKKYGIPVKETKDGTSTIWHNDLQEFVTINNLDSIKSVEFSFYLDD